VTCPRDRRILKGLTPHAVKGSEHAVLPGRFAGRIEVRSTQMIEQDLEGRRVFSACKVLPGALQEERCPFGKARPCDPYVFEARLEAPKRVFEHGEQNAILIAKVVLDGTPGDSSAACDLLSRGALKSKLRDAINRCAQDAPARVRRAFGVRTAETPSRPRTNARSLRHGFFDLAALRSARSSRTTWLATAATGQPP